MESVYHFVMCLVCLLAVLPQKSIGDDISDNTISVRFDKDNGELLLRKEWTPTETTNFKNITATGINVECKKEKVTCPSNVVNFTSKDVIVDEKDIQNFNGDMRFKFYVSTGGQVVLDESILTAAVTNSRENYNDELASPDAGFAITLMFVGNVRVAEPLDHSLNIILSVVSVVLLLTFCFLALVLKCKENMDAKTKLQAVDGRVTTTVANDGEEVLTLTAIKSVDDDSKEASEAQPMI